MNEEIAPFQTSDYENLPLDVILHKLWHSAFLDCMYLLMQYDNLLKGL